MGHLEVCLFWFRLCEELFCKSIWKHVNMHLSCIWTISAFAWASGLMIK
jgi:hypothetical protein